MPDPLEQQLINRSPWSKATGIGPDPLMRDIDKYGGMKLGEMPMEPFNPRAVEPIIDALRQLYKVSPARHMKIFGPKVSPWGTGPKETPMVKSLTEWMASKPDAERYLSDLSLNLHEGQSTKVTGTFMKELFQQFFGE